MRAGTDVLRFLDEGPFEFVVLCVPAVVAPTWVRQLIREQIPVLVETPVAPDLRSLGALISELPLDAPVQVSEQYRYQPLHAARLAVAASGLLGPVHSASCSIAHDYHAISLLRAALGIGFAEARVTAHHFTDRVLSSLGRDGWDENPRVRATNRVSARIEFTDTGALALYDFGPEQYFSPIRSRHLSIAGERGELVDDDIVFLRGPGDAVRLTLRREDTGADGDLEGRFLRKITLGERTLYENPFTPARLSDDEIAIATTLTHMTRYARTGEPFYSLADAAEDQYLSSLIHQACLSGCAEPTSERRWAASSSAVSR